VVISIFHCSGRKLKFPKGNERAYYSLGLGTTFLLCREFSWLLVLLSSLLLSFFNMIVIMLSTLRYKIEDFVRNLSAKIKHWIILLDAREQNQCLIDHFLIYLFECWECLFLLNISSFFRNITNWAPKEIMYFLKKKFDPIFDINQQIDRICLINCSTLSFYYELNLPFSKLVRSSLSGLQKIIIILFWNS